ncbi:hypothetical protein THOM_0368 [Trachipleistophora hominis]|uniref:Uncharacterized protein n=1 Tax=Trachipleistophora hominis TaxID=72359 RepID=L7JZ01_TRAHO|nr:hypothetical protein THOM_0368 [Trachipleistophora hominis]
MLLKYYLSKIFGQKLTFAKKPNLIFIINAYQNISLDEIQRLRDKYGIEKIVGLQRDDFDTFYTQEQLDRNNLPDLIIYCNIKLEFKLRQPEILYKAEIVFSRFGFSEGLFVKALDHFSKCIINNGK